MRISVVALVCLSMSAVVVDVAGFARADDSMSYAPPLRSLPRPPYAPAMRPMGPPGMRPMPPGAVLGGPMPRPGMMRRFEGPGFEGPRFDGPRFGGRRFDGPRFEAPRGRVCFNPQETREKIAAHRLTEPFRALRTGRLQGEALRARLCRWKPDEFVYEVAVLRRDGRIVHVYMNAQNGENVGAFDDPDRQ